LTLMLGTDQSHQVDPHDLQAFRNLGFITLGLGLTVTLIFYVTVKEPVEACRPRGRVDSIASQTSAMVRMSWKHWFSHIQFYQVAILYMLTRMFINVSQVYYPYYIQYTQGFPKKYCAIFPMVSYIASFSVSLIISIPFINRRLNRKLLYIFGSFVGVLNCAIMHMDHLYNAMYAVAILLGIAQATVLVTSLTITAELINTNTESGAFVYGAMSLLDKLGNGIAYLVIEMYSPSDIKDRDDVMKPAPEAEGFYREIMVFVPGTCLLAAMIIAFLLLPQNVGRRNHRFIVDGSGGEHDVLITNSDRHVTYDAI